MGAKEFWPDFVRAEKLSRAAWDTTMRKLGARGGQNRLLHVLWTRDGATPGEIARELHVSPPTIVKMAARMDAAGLLRRRRDARDRRVVHLYLTDRGRSLQQPMEEALRQFVRVVSAGLTEAERAHLASALAKMVGNLERAERDAGTATRLAG